MAEDTAAAEPAFPRAEAWLRDRPRRVLALLVVVAAFLRLILVLQVAGGPLARQHEFVTSSDNRFFHAWAQHLASGDWLQREPTFPMMGWMQQAVGYAMSADPGLPVRLGLASDTSYDRAEMGRRLWQHWLGERTYYQEPAYAYLVALTYALFGADVWPVLAWQMLLGVLGVALVWSIARKVGGELAAAVAGALAVLYPVLPFLEINLMRDALVVFGTLLLTWAMLWAPEGGRGRWFVLGLLFGAAILIKQSFLFFAPLFAVARLCTVRAPRAGRAQAAGLVLLGMALGFLPVVLRNLLVGVPPTAINGSASSMLALFHTSDATPTALSASPVYVRILIHSDGKFWPAVVEAARTHTSLAAFALFNLEKLAYAFHGYELPNNVDLYVFRHGAPLLQWLPVTFPLVAVLSAAGLATRRIEKLAPVAVAAVAQIPTMLLALPLSRYRAPMAAALLPLAGLGAVRLASWIRQKKLVRLGVAAALAAGYTVWTLQPPVGYGARERAQSYRSIAAQAMAARQPSFAAMNLMEARDLEPGDASILLELGRAHLAASEDEEALAPLGRAASMLGSAEAREAHAEALFRLGRLDEARAEARAALSLEPGRPRAQALAAGQKLPAPEVAP